jgi:putative oxidoreductase
MPIDDKYAPYGAFALRVALGIMYLTHSLVLKLFVFTLAGNAQFFSSIGLPAWFGYAVFFAEAVGGALLVLGVYARPVAIGLVPVLLGATWVHWGNGWMFSSPNGGWEYPVFLIVASLAVALVGDGAYALKRTPAALGAWLAKA